MLEETWRNARTAPMQGDCGDKQRELVDEWSHSQHDSTQPSEGATWSGLEKNTHRVFSPSWPYLDASHQ